jgi:hypothetical protein
MEKNKESVVGILEQLAVITDATQVLFPQGKTIMVFELNREDFKRVQGNFRGIDQYHNKFSIDISGVELVFILEGEVNYDDPTEIKVEEPPSLKKKLRNLFSGFKSSGPPVK